MNIAQIGAAAFMSLLKKRDTQIFIVLLRELDNFLDEEKQYKVRLAYAVVKLLDKNINPAIILKPDYHEFLPLFSRQKANKLPLHRPYDHYISLLPEKTPPFSPLYGISREENKELRKFLKENLDKCFIRASQSPAASPVMFVKKPGGGLRFCVDYRALNNISVKSRYPLPLISETLNKLSKAVVFTKLDIISAFNRIRMVEG